MSCKFCGYGFSVVDSLNVECEDDFEETMDPLMAAKFLKNHRKAFGKSEQEKEILKVIDNAKNDDDLEDAMMNLIENKYYDEETLDYGIGAVVSTVMRRETGINFKYYGPEVDFCTFPSVVFVTSYPWEFNEVEKALKKSDLHDICQRYMKEIGLDDTPGDTELEYYG